MKPAAKIVAIIFCITTICIIISVALTVIYRNDIVNAALEAAAKNNELYFKSQSIEVKFSMSLRNTALLFGHVDVHSRQGVSAVGVALQAETLRVEVDLLHFAVHREIKVKKLLVQDGELTLRLPPRRRRRPAASPPMPDTEALLHGLRRIQLERCRVKVERGAGRSVAVEVKTLGAGLGHDKEALTLHLKSALTVQVSENQKPEQASAAVSVDLRGRLAQGVATVTGCALSVNGVALEATGSAALRPPGEVRLSVTGKSLSIERAVGQVRKYVAFDAPERLSGRADVRVRLAGSLAEKATLSLAGSGTAHNVALKLKGVEEISAKKLRYSLTCSDVKNLQSYACAIGSDGVSCGGFRFDGEGAIRSFKAPLYEVNAGFSGNVAALKVENLLEGQVEGTAQVRARDWSGEGVEAFSVQASLSNLKVRLQKEVYTLSGQLSADESTLRSQLNVAGSAVEGALDATAQGYLAALTGKRKEGAPKIRATLTAKHLNIDTLLAQGHSSASGLNIGATLNAQVDELTAFGYLYKNVSGVVDYSARSLAVNKLRAEAFDGTLGGDVKLYAAAGKSGRLGCDLYFNGVQLESLPYLHKALNVKPGSMQGKCSGAITLASDVGGNGPNMDNLSATVNFTVSSGRLLKFAPVQPLSAYLKKSLLQDIRFSALQNTVSLEKGKITIPKMEVRSTALNAIIAGTQELKGDFDYHITLYLNELLSKKEKDIENPIKENKTKLFLRFTAKNGVTEVHHDAREWSKNMEKKVLREAQEVKSLLRSRHKADKPSQAVAPKTEKIAVEWDEAAEQSEAAETDPLEAKYPNKEKKKEKEKRKEEKKNAPEKAKQRSAVEVEWEEEG
ncbi:MAG: AsmA-like C-terminal region-containing protein [Prevotellaceae bacterium]|jgi:hypothetical protein|nr:AsmA-like C-terminal region-containing protein [Prevotellaceae bacterium]